MFFSFFKLKGSGMRGGISFPCSEILHQFWLMVQILCCYNLFLHLDAFFFNASLFDEPSFGWWLNQQGGRLSV